MITHKVILFYFSLFLSLTFSTKISISDGITTPKYSSYNLFYQKIYNDLVFYNPNIEPINYFISFTDQGIPVSKEFFDFSDSTNGANLIEFSKLVDIIPNVKGPFIQPTSPPTSTPNLLSETFLQILNNATFTFNSPVNPLSTQQKQHLQNIFDDFKTVYNNGTINDSDTIKKCLIYRNAMNILTINYQTVMEFILTPDATEQDIETFSKIEDNWSDINEYYKSKSQVYCYEIDSDNSFIKQYTGYSSSYYIDFIKKSMNGSLKLDTTFSEDYNTTYYPSYYYPPKYFQFNDSDVTLFTKFVFNQTNDITFPNIDTTFIGLNENKNFNFELIDNQGKQSLVTIDENGMKITFEISTIPVHRSWFDENVLTSNNWDLNDQGYYSNGKLGGIIGIYTNGVIIASNISITLNTTNNEINQNAIKQLLNSKTAYFGSLFIKGLVNDIPSKETTPIVLNDNTILYPGTQIIGFKCSILPVLPNYNNNPTPPPSTLSTSSSVTSSSSSTSKSTSSSVISSSSSTSTHSSSSTTSPSQKTSSASFLNFNVKLSLIIMILLFLLR
ncbi:hypothetical protein RB653_000078 [Dictyostelium firmibasis]|uniref:Uncharacterized protein n=1 Tax=Dictyostelium firmibasis TaxID=79012 RepID=A0AAN7U6K9_9MYCE